MFGAEANGVARAAHEATGAVTVREDGISDGSIATALDRRQSAPGAGAVALERDYVGLEVGYSGRGLAGVRGEECAS